MLEISGKHPDITDEELLLLFKSKGSLDVLGELYSRYMHLVYGVALKYLGGRDEAKDTVMQIFEKLITDLPGHEVRNFKSWLYVLSKNHCLMQLRSQKSADGKMEGYYDMWIERCEFQKTQKLPKDWNGVFIATSK